MKRELPTPIACLAVALTLSAIAGGCNARDYYSEVAAPCAYVNLPSKLVISKDRLPEVDLRRPCRDALEAIVPFDDSWKSAPSGLKEMVLQAFQVVVAYPLALPPENRILGQAPYSIPLWSLRILETYGTYNQSLFNHALEVIQTVHYSSDKNSDASASLTPKALVTENVLTVYDSFSETLGLSPLYYTGGFLRAGTIIHEARHGDSTFHGFCPDGSGTECDAQLTGAYGFETVYWELLLHGSGSKGLGGKPPLLGDLDVMWIGTFVCLDLKGRVTRLPRDLASFLNGVDCTSKGAKFYAGLEGLDRDFTD